jgi:hypothetical protein
MAVQLISHKYNIIKPLWKVLLDFASDKGCARARVERDWNGFALSKDDVGAGLVAGRDCGFG